MEKSRRQLAKVLALVLILLAFWAAGKYFWGSGNGGQDHLTITALSVGKADALIVQCEEHVFLIDAGEQDDKEEVVNALKQRGINQIDLFLVTHFDKDHVGGGAYVMEQMEVASVLMPDYEGDREEYQNFLESLQGHPDVRRLTKPFHKTFGSLQITVYPAENPEEIQDTKGEYDNDMSLVASLSYGSRKFLLTGDIEKGRICQMLAAETDWGHDWIKMPHHGRYQKELKELLEAVSPQWAVICCSGKNPAEEKTLALLEQTGAKVWDTSGQAVVTWCDGEEIRVEYGN